MIEVQLPLSNFTRYKFKLIEIKNIYWALVIQGGPFQTKMGKIIKVIMIDVDKLKITNIITLFFYIYNE